MRSLLFTVLFFSICSFGQDGISEALIVKKDSISFYSFTTEGVYESTLSSDSEINYTFSKYSTPLPKTLKKIEINSLETTILNDIVYFLYPGGGILYKYFENSIIRIDDSFAHRNQFSGFFFSHDNELYLLGGYGYWSSKNLLTKFNFQSGSWDVVNTKGVPPNNGIDQGSYIKSGNSIYVFDFFSRSANNIKEVPNPFLFEFDVANKTWINKGRLKESPAKNSVESTILTVRTAYGESLFSMSPGKDTFRIINPKKNMVSIFEKENSLSKISENSIFIGNNLVYLSKSADNLTFKIALVNLNNFKINETIKLALDKKEIFGIYLIFSGIFLVMLVLTLFFVFKSKDILYTITDSTVYNEKGVLSLKNYEKVILILFSKKSAVENSAILDVFSDKTKSMDSIIKKKNKAIKDLNAKFQKSFGHNLVQKKPDKFDSRQIIYTLSSKAKIVLD